MEIVPTLTRTGMYYSIKKQRPLIPKEHLAVMGLPVFDFLAASCGYKVPFQHLIDEGILTSAQLKALAGNGISLPVICAILFYVFCNLEKRDHTSLSQMTDDGGPDCESAPDAQPWDR
jgi:hypothetical protein